MLDQNLQVPYEARYLELGERAVQHNSLLARREGLFANLILMSGNLKSPIQKCITACLKSEPSSLGCYTDLIHFPI